jgi:hypothetical protein
MPSLFGPQSRPPGLFGELAPEQPIVDRFAMLPIGQHADGSFTPAWPGMIKDTYDSLVNSYGDVAAGRTPKTQDVLNVASAPVLGNLAARFGGGQFATSRGAEHADDAVLRTRAYLDAWENPKGPRFEGQSGVGLAQVDGMPGVFRITKDGAIVGKAAVDFKDGAAHIGSIEVDGGPNTLGVSGIRDLREAFRNFHPEVSEFTSGQGQRVSGSRNGPAAAANDKTQNVRLNANAPEGSLLSLAQQFLNQDEQAKGPRR